MAFDFTFSHHNRVETSLPPHTYHIPRPSDQEMSSSLSFKSLAVSLRTNRLNIQKFYMVLALRSVLCTDIRTDRDFCFVQH